jgi:hypothetical protein
VTLSQRIARRTLTVAPLAAALAVAGATGAAAQPAAHAAAPATALHVSAPGCIPNMAGQPGTVGSMHCSAPATGGTTPYHYQWVVTSGPASVNPTGTPKFGLTSGSCTYGKYFTVQVTVTDAASAQSSASGTSYCDPTGP